MKSNVTGRVVPQPGSSSGCRPHNFFYNFHHQSHQSQQQQQHQQHQHQQHHHQQQHNLPFHPHHQQQQQQQQPPPQPPPHHQNYAMLPCFNQHNTSGWAGIPLISTAASSNRRQRKPTVAGHRHPPQQPMSCNSLQMYNSNRDLHSNEYDLNPMTRLAMHTQGAPLLLTGSYNRNRLNCNRQLRPLNPNSSEGYSPCGYKPNGPMNQKTKENNISGPIGGGVGSNTQSDSTAVACLPRIIKPRKRRKKDRKPLPNTNNFVKKIDHETDGGISKREYPLYIDHHHQHHTLPSSQMLGYNEFENRCNLNNDDEPSHVTADAQDPATGYICFCRQCDPLSRIWAFPLRRSHSDNSSDTTEFEKEKATIKNVGVIGSNRSSHQVNIKNTNHTGSLSDSSDSGYGDILSGIQIGDNFFRNDNNNNNNYWQLQKLPNDLLLSPTAESLLTESINEISRKLMETCDIKGASAGSSSSSSPSSSSSSSASSDSCSVFSDSGLSSATSNNPPSGDELIFNFENLSINPLNHPNLLFPTTTSNSNNSKATSESMFDCFSTSDINNNTIHVPGDGGGSPRIDPQLFNCLDMLWGTQSPPSSSSSLHSDALKQTPSSSSSSSSASSSSFYRSAVASM